MTGRERAALTPAQHYLFLQRSPLCEGRGTLKKGALAWVYRVRPTALSREYEVCIKHDAGAVPDIFILSPSLSDLAGGRDIPHVYRNPLRLCLYFPGSGEWQGWMRIDETFVPWTATWLYYFEEWLKSDEWKGGGVHPDRGEPDDRNRHQRRRQKRANG